jgi:hypothetical protein
LWFPRSQKRDLGHPNLWGAIRNRRVTVLEQFSNSRALVNSAQSGFYGHRSDQDLSLHPSEQKSRAGDPESLGPRTGRSHFAVVVSGYNDLRTAVAENFSWKPGRAGSGVRRGRRKARIVAFSDSLLRSSNSTVIWCAELIFSNIGTCGKNLRPPMKKFSASTIPASRSLP